MQTCKPGSVSFGERIPSGFRHFSGTMIAHRLKQPTHPDVFLRRAATGRCRFGAYLVFQRLGFTPYGCRQPTRALLPHVFTLTGICIPAVSFSAALSVFRRFLRGSLPVRKQAALCCPDFPPFIAEQRRNSLRGKGTKMWCVGAGCGVANVAVLRMLRCCEVQGSPKCAGFGISRCIRWRFMPLRHEVLSFVSLCLSGCFLFAENSFFPGCCGGILNTETRSKKILNGWMAQLQNCMPTEKPMALIGRNFRFSHEGCVGS